MSKHYSASRTLQAINPVIGIWSFIIPYHPRANSIITHTLDIIFVSVASAFPAVGFTYVALFALHTFGFGIDSARFASITKARKDITSSIVHFLTGAVFVTAASLVFVFCPNPFIPMLVITLLANTLNICYIRATCLGSFYDCIVTCDDGQKVFREYASGNRFTFLTSGPQLNAQVQKVDNNFTGAFNNTDLETVYHLKYEPTFINIPNYR